jgi:hypothetical protein
LVAHLRNKFYDKRDLVKTAIKKSGKSVKKFEKDNSKNILKEGITIEDIDNYLKKDKINNDRFINLKQMCGQLLDYIGNKIDDQNKKLISDYIETVTEVDIFNKILNVLSINYFFGDNITHTFLMNKIELGDEMNNFFE